MFNDKLCVLLFLLFKSICAWESEQLEVFDVVEEVKENFYQLLNISKDADSAQIRSSFRKLSVILHPDKNLHEDTSEKFRNLVSVYEVLKDSKKRAYYDDVLVNGLPNWKSAMYYYRRVRRMGLLEGSIIIFLIFTIGQYLVAWGSYFEQRFNQSANMPKMKKSKKNQTQATVVLDEIPKPSVLNTLPFQIPYGLYYLIISIPSLLVACKQTITDKIEERMAALKESSDDESDTEEQKEAKKQRRRKKAGFEYPEGPSYEVIQTKATELNGTTAKPVSAVHHTPSVVSGGFWSDDDLADLIQLVKKYPAGVSGRWEIISEFMNRTIGEVTFMANKIKENGYRIQNPEEIQSIEELKVKQKTKGGKLGNLNEQGEGSNSNSAGGGWTQIQQRALEDALSKYPKGCTERWERVAEAVPKKTKEECMLRYKYLVEVVKEKQKDK